MHETFSSSCCSWAPSFSTVVKVVCFKTLPFIQELFTLRYNFVNCFMYVPLFICFYSSVSNRFKAICSHTISNPHPDVYSCFSMFWISLSLSLPFSLSVQLKWKPVPFSTLQQSPSRKRMPITSIVLFYIFLWHVFVRMLRNSVKNWFIAPLKTSTRIYHKEQHNFSFYGWQGKHFLALSQSMHNHGYGCQLNLMPVTFQQNWNEHLRHYNLISKKKLWNILKKSII